MRFNSYSVPTALALAVLVASVMDANALTIFDDGGTHTIDAGNATADMGVIVRDGPTNPTTLNIVGGTTGVESNGIALLIEGSSTVTISGGTLLGHADVSDAAVLNILGGVIRGGVNAVSDSSVVNITGGFFGGNGDAGSVDADAGVLNISGGTFTEMDIFGGSANIFGSGFNFPLGPIPVEFGTLTGTLADGTALNVGFARDPGSPITLIPEPSTALLLASGLVALAMGRMRRV